MSGMRFAAAAVLLVLVGCGDKIGAEERARVMTMRSAWVAAARAERCERPALRAPAGNDASVVLARMNVRTSPGGACLAQFVDPKDHPEHLAACEPLFESIERVAHASETCSPYTRAGTGVASAR